MKIHAQLLENDLNNLKILKERFGTSNNVETMRVALSIAAKKQEALL